MLNFALTNIANNGREIILFHRVGKELKEFHDSSFFPYFYNLDERGMFRTIDNKKVTKIICSKPYDIAKKRTDTSYEADILFTRRYIIDKIGQILPCEIKYSFIDLEVKCPELPSFSNPIYPIVCISASNSYTGEIKTFWIKDYMTTGEMEDAEKLLLDDFVKWIKIENFDWIGGWNFISFDYRYLLARYKYINGTELSDLLSSIFRSRFLGNKDDSILIPQGLGIVDFLAWFKKIYRGRQSYALDNIAQEELGETSLGKFDFNQLTDDIKEKNIIDVKRLIKINNKLRIVDYYNQLRIMSKADWTELDWNSKLLDMMILSEAKQKNIILPSKKYEQEETEETFEGAYRECRTGLYKSLFKLDLGSAYPSAIVDFCLDIGNIRANEGVDIKGIRFAQNNNALLPSLAKKLITKKDELKKQLKTLNPESIEYKDLEIKYSSVKGVVNSLFGICGLKIFRLFDLRIASSITFLIRDLLHYVKNKLVEQGIKVIYVDTDSFFLEAKENPVELCNQLIQQWAKEKYNKEHVNIVFDLEGKISTIFIIGMCHYIAEIETKNGIKKEIKGVEVRRSDASKFMKHFQEELIDKIMKEESKESIEQFINQQKEIIKTRPLTEIGFPCKLSKLEESYSSIPIFMRGLRYTTDLVPEFKKVNGDSFWYIPVLPFGEATRKSQSLRKNKETGEKELKKSETTINKDVLCFDNDNPHYIKNEEIDWKKMIEKTITNKVKKIFEAMKWDLSQVIPVKPKKERKKKEPKLKKDSIGFDNSDTGLEPGDSEEPSIITEVRNVAESRAIEDL